MTPRRPSGSKNPPRPPTPDPMPEDPYHTVDLEPCPDCGAPRLEEHGSGCPRLADLDPTPAQAARQAVAIDAAGKSLDPPRAPYGPTLEQLDARLEILERAPWAPRPPATLEEELEGPSTPSPEMLAARLYDLERDRASHNDRLHDLEAQRAGNVSRIGALERTIEQQRHALEVRVEELAEKTAPALVASFRKLTPDLTARLEGQLANLQGISDGIAALRAQVGLPDQTGTAGSVEQRLGTLARAPWRPRLEAIEERLEQLERNEPHTTQAARAALHRAQMLEQRLDALQIPPEAADLTSALGLRARVEQLERNQDHDSAETEHRLERLEGKLEPPKHPADVDTDYVNRLREAQRARNREPLEQAPRATTDALEPPGRPAGSVALDYFADVENAVRALGRILERR